MMKKSKILININTKEEMEYYKKIGITNFLFAVSNYSVGYNTFGFNEIPYDAYLLINRVMDNKTIDELKKDKDTILKYRGIIYEDVGVFNIFKDSDIELIWFQNHFNTNYNSINYWLKNGCTSALIGNEITKEEIFEIVDKSIKPLVINVLGKNQIMYSRRSLLSNFNKYKNLKDYNDMILDVNHNDQVFFARESEFGTTIFNNEYFNYIEFANSISEDKIYYYLVMNLDLEPVDIEAILSGKEFGNDGFLNKKTVYKMSEYTDRK